METKPLGPLSGPDERLLDKWRTGGPIGRQELFILILSGLILLIAILMGIIAITSDLLNGMDADQIKIRNGIEQRLVWFGVTPNLTDDQQTGIRPTSEDGHNQTVGPRQQDPRNDALSMGLHSQA